MSLPEKSHPPAAQELTANGRAVIAGTLVFRDAAGNIVGETPFSGTLPLIEEPSDDNLGE